MPNSEERIRATAALLAEPSRVELLTRLAERPSYPSELATALGLSAQSVSKHLTRLRYGGLVSTQREGRRIRYEVTGPEVVRVLQDLSHLGNLALEVRLDDDIPAYAITAKEQL